MPVTGPIRVSDNRRYFVDASGKPFFWLGDTAWPLYTSYSRADTSAYLQARSQQGFTVIQGVLAWGNPIPEVSLEGTGPQANCDGEHPWKDSPAQINPGFFRRVDEIVNEADQLGLALAIVPTWGFNVQQAKAFTEATAFAYGKFLGQRYRDAANIVWMNGGDREPLGFEPIWRAISRGLRDGDAGRHLITYHPCGWRSSSFYFHNDDWLDFNMIETWSDWPHVHPAVLADYCLTPAKPVVLGEAAYENGPEYPHGPITPLIVRRQAWWTLTAGGFATYGQDQMWRMGKGWAGTFHTPGAVHMGVFRKIAESRPWWTMIPDQSLYADGASTGRTLNTAMRTLDRRCAMLYLASQCHFVVQLDRIAAPKAKATFLDPRTGEARDAGTHETGNAGPGTFPRWCVTQPMDVPGHWEDAVLILDGEG